MQHGLGGGDADDEVGLEERPVDAERCAPGVADVHEVRRLRVVNRDHAVEAAGGDRWEERLLLPVPGAAVEASRDQDRLPLRGHAKPLELGERGRERLAARVIRGAG